MSWDRKFDKSALKDLQKIPKQRAKHILQAITVIAKDPFLKNNNIKRLSGVLSGYYRLRIGDFRVLFLLDQDEQTLYVKAVLPRNAKTYK